jgi:type IV pilus assembly protein PilM
MRCRAHEEPDKVVVEAFDFIEYPKILTQPDANPTELIAEALKQFLSRNVVRDARVAVSVSGQSGLARFIKLPPVEARKIPDIVRYEARQQIPFDLNDVIWDYQRMGGGAEEEGFVLETEIGLFAMKRDAVFRALEPFREAGIEVDIVQLTPLALYNYVLFDQLHDLPPPDEYDPENPPESVVVVSLGTDASDLVVTNGYRVWQRSVPLGGSHFTKALTKDLKLTFAKAEHLKRNATTAQDPKAVFQAMRPVFNDLQTELQRSLGYFTNIDRAAKISRVIALGNAFKLPGLRRYLAQSLGFDIQRVEAFRGLIGPEVLGTPAFKENILSFGVCYGLVLQALGLGGLKTNLLPREISRDRLIREKKPWAVAAAALIMLACSVSFASYSLQLGTVNEGMWKTAEDGATRVSGQSDTLKKRAETAVGMFRDTENIGKHLVSNVEGRTRWLALLRAINESLPPHQWAVVATGSNPPRAVDQTPPGEFSKPPPKDVAERNQVQITNIDCQQVDDLSKWFAGVKPWYVPLGGAPPGGTAPGATAPGAGGEAADAGPAGPGMIVQLVGYHYHNSGELQGAEYVKNTLLKNLATGPVRSLGGVYPVLLKPGRVESEEIVAPRAMRTSGHNLGPGLKPGGTEPAGPAAEDKMLLSRFDFRIQFVWNPAAPAEQGGDKPTNPLTR